MEKLSLRFVVWCLSISFLFLFTVPVLAQAEEEDEAMATAFKVQGKGTTVWLYNGTQLHRYASGTDLARDRRLGLVPDKTVPTKSLADFQAIRRKLGID